MLTAPAYRSINISPTAPFDLQPSSGRGWGAFTTWNIARGSTILHEEPLFVIRKPHQEITEVDVRNAFQRLPAPEKQQFSYLRDNAALPFLYMESAFAENSFAILDRETGRGIVHGCFLLHSRINHSCLPNVKVPDEQPGEAITSYAT